MSNLNENPKISRKQLASYFGYLVFIFYELMFNISAFQTRYKRNEKSKAINFEVHKNRKVITKVSCSVSCEISSYRRVKLIDY